MKEIVTQATVIMAKCIQSRQPFGIRTEQRANGAWYCTWAFKISEKSATHEGYSDTSVSGAVGLTDEYPGCPYCGASGWFSCENCGKLTCYSGESSVTCGWCGNSGGCSPADSFDLKGGGY